MLETEKKLKKTSERGELKKSTEIRTTFLTMNVINSVTSNISNKKSIHIKFHFNTKTSTSKYETVSNYPFLHCFRTSTDSVS